MKDIIYLHNIKTSTIIGILPHEQVQPQSLIISLEMETDFSQAIESDDISHAINYAAVADCVCAFARDSAFGLLEVFAAALLEELFGQFSPAQAITITLQKPGAIAATREVGLKMRRSREA